MPLKKLKSHEDAELFQRMQFLESFLNNCLYQPLLRNSKPMHEFLYISDETTFKNKIKVKLFNFLTKIINIYLKIFFYFIIKLKSFQF